MARDPWWHPYERDALKADQRDVELNAAHELAFAREAETWFSREGVRDCV